MKKDAGGMKVKVRVVFLLMLMVSMAVLSGCQKAEPVQTADNSAANVPAADGRGDAAPNPELDNVSRLTLGTLKLEGTANAVTPEQAAKLLPLWKLIQGGALNNDAETNAVIKQIEGQMTEAQLAMIDALGLTMEDMMAWMQEQGIEMAAPGDAPAGGQGAPGNMSNMTDEERQQMRERFENMTEEERAAAMAEGGFQRPEGAPQDQGGPQGQAAGDRQPPTGDRPGMGGMRSGAMMLEPLIALLTERAAQ